MGIGIGTFTDCDLAEETFADGQTVISSSALAKVRYAQSNGAC